MVRRPSDAVLLSKELSDLLEGLEPDNKLRKWIEDMAVILKENMFAGDRIRKRKIPASYVERYGVNNLYRYAHPEGHRSCYTILNVEGLGLCPVILDIRNHAGYERVFGYRRG